MPSDMPDRPALPAAQLARDRAQRRARRGVRVGQHDRLALVAALAQPYVDRDGPSTGTSAPVVRVRPSATRWPPPVPKTSTISSQCGHGRPGHVLDHADDLLVGLHGDRAGPLGDLGRGLLRGGHDQDLRVRHQLGDRDRDVAGARAAGRAAGRRGRPSRRRRGTAGAPGAASGRARRPGRCPG